jgi:hypothetical protein
MARNETRNFTAAGGGAFRGDLGSSAGDSWLRRVAHDHFKPFDEGSGFCAKNAVEENKKKLDFRAHDTVR